MTGEPENQFSPTRVALGTGGRDKTKLSPPSDLEELVEG